MVCRLSGWMMYAMLMKMALLELVEHLPDEAGEALLELAVGGTPQIAQPVTVADPFDHPDAQRRFRLMTNVEELERALDFPWEKWAIFLHPAQRQVVERDYNGPFRVSGTAGTGKTVVAIHRAACSSCVPIRMRWYCSPHSPIHWRMFYAPNSGG